MALVPSCKLSAPGFTRAFRRNAFSSAPACSASRYVTAGACPASAKSLAGWQREGRLVVLCPEIAGGLLVPRIPAEIERGAGGAAVLLQTARVIDRSGRELTEYFVQGAEAAARLVLEQGIRVAVLKENSPSCGTTFTYDGQFSADASRVRA